MADTVTKNGSHKRATMIGGDSPTNGAEEAIATTIPYTAEVTIRGVADILFKRWNCEAVAEKASAAKGSKAKKTDDLETFVYRDDDGQICIPGEYLRGAIIAAARNRQDPRSTRKTAMDLFKAGVVSLTPLAPLGKKQWDYEHKARVLIQRNAVTRTRPAFKAGWEATFQFLIGLPEYIGADLLLGVINDAGRFVGVGDFRPTYGRFQVTAFKMQD